MRRLQERRAVAALTGRRRFAVIAATVLAVVAVDQASKTWAVHHLAGRSIHLVWTLRLALSYNSGASFSIGRGMAPVFMALGVVLLVTLLFMTRSVRATVTAIALGLVIGGAVGNLTDRFVRGNDGAVVDFVDLQWWPVFNVADASLVSGAVLLALTHREVEK